MSRSSHTAGYWRFARQPQRNRNPGEHGMALVVVLWIVTALTVLILSFNTSVRSHLDVTSSELDIAHAEEATSAAIRLAVYKLREPDLERRWQPDGRDYKVNIVGRAVTISIRDEKGFVDINKADAATLSGVIAQHVEDRDEVRRLTARIIDWRDTDQKTTPNGAEDPAYVAAGRPNGAGDRPFAAIVELSSVLGISTELRDRLAKDMTVFNGSPKLNLLTASRSTLKALPEMTTGALDQMLRLRKSDFKPDEILAMFEKWRKYLSVSAGPAYRIRIDITDPNIIPTATEVTVLLLEGNPQPYYGLDWQELRPRPR